MSNNLLIKSKENFELASSLYNSKKYVNSIVHCSYYSSLQLIKYVVIFELGRDEKSIENEANFKKTGTNNLLISLLFKELNERNKSDAVDLHTAIKELKQLRVDSDYGINYYPSKNDLLISTLKSKIVNGIILKYFKL